MIDTWRPRPLRTAILEVLSSKGALTFEELMRELRKEQGFDDTSESELLTGLMALEVEGLVRVTTFAKGSKRIEPIAGPQEE